MFVSRKFAQLTEYFCTKGNLHCWPFASGLGLHPYPGIPKPPQGHAHVCFWSNAFRFWFVFLNSSTTTELESIACALFRRVIEQTALSQHGSGGPPPPPRCNARFRSGFCCLSSDPGQVINFIKFLYASVSSSVS